MAQIENGQNLVTIDENAHIFVWEYNKDNLKQTFAPAFKYRISLNYEKFKLLSEKLMTNRKTQYDMRNIYEQSLDLRHEVLQGRPGEITGAGRTFGRARA
jgi:hypothetical protein